MGYAKSEAEVLKHMGLQLQQRGTGCNPCRAWVAEKVKALDAVLEALQPGGVQSVLDLGIGELDVMEAWDHFDNVRYTGVDGCAAIIAEAADRHAEAGSQREFVLSPFSALVTTDTMQQPQAFLYDLVLALDILYHVQDDALHDSLLKWVFASRKAVVLSFAREVRDYGGRKPGQAGFAWFPRPEVEDFVRSQEGWQVVYTADSVTGPPQRLVALVREFIYNGW